MNNKGQSLIEVVFAIGLIMLVVTGIVSLLVSSSGSRTKSYDRNRAVELSQLVMEGIVANKESDPTNFWNLNSSYWTTLGQNQTNPSFVDYSYIATPTVYSGNGCSATMTQCMNVVVKITWKNTNTDSQFNRFFSRR